MTWHLLVTGKFAKVQSFFWSLDVVWTTTTISNAPGKLIAIDLFSVAYNNLNLKLFHWINMIPADGVWVHWQIWASSVRADLLDVMWRCHFAVANCFVELLLVRLDGRDYKTINCYKTLVHYYLLFRIYSPLAKRSIQDFHKKFKACSILIQD